MSSQLLQFLISQYDMAYTRIGWLCSRCHAFESQKMMTHQSMEFNHDESSSGDELMTEGSPVNDSENDDETTDPESMNEEIGHVFYELEHQKGKAMEELSNIFELLTIDPIHDRLVCKFHPNFLKRHLYLDQQYYPFEQS